MRSTFINRDIHRKISFSGLSTVSNTSPVLHTCPQFLRIFSCPYEYATSTSLHRHGRSTLQYHYSHSSRRPRLLWLLWTSTTDASFSARSRTVRLLPRSRHATESNFRSMWKATKLRKTWIEILSILDRVIAKAQLGLKELLTSRMTRTRINRVDLARSLSRWYTLSMQHVRQKVEPANWHWTRASAL